MKKYFLALSFFLVSCTMENLTLSNKPKNEQCMDMERFKIFQTFPANYALAYSCKGNDGDYCWETVVLLTPQRGIDYYDGMFVSSPAGKCAVQDGVYRYESKSGLNTVPRIRWTFKYKPENEDAAVTQLKEYMEDSINECKLIYKSDKETNTDENMKKCDCAVKEVFKYRIQQTDDNEITTKNLLKNVEEKCGKMPDFL